MGTCKNIINDNSVNQKCVDYSDETFESKAAILNSCYINSYCQLATCTCDVYLYKDGKRLDRIQGWVA